MNISTSFRILYLQEIGDKDFIIIRLRMMRLVIRRRKSEFTPRLNVSDVLNLIDAENARKCCSPDWTFGLE
jgi:hypothetical protein